jgi:hypothetical protein
MVKLKKITGPNKFVILEMYIVLFHIVWHIRTNTTDHIANVDEIIGIFSTTTKTNLTHFLKKTYDLQN